MVELIWEVKEVYSKVNEKSYDLLINPQIKDGIIEFNLYCYDYLEHRKINYNIEYGRYKIPIESFKNFIQMLERDLVKLIG
jgi:hypothetical protein